MIAKTFRILSVLDGFLAAAVMLLLVGFGIGANLP